MERVKLKSYNATVIVSGLTGVFALIGFSLYALIGVLTDEWNFGWIGIYLAMLSYGAGNLYAAKSTRDRAEQYNDLSKKLDTIASRQEDLISLVQSSSLHSSEEAPNLDSLTNSVDSIEAANDRVRNSLNSNNRA